LENTSIIEVLRPPLASADRPSVAVMHDPPVGTAPLEGHEQRIDHQIGVGGGAHGPADDSPAEEVDDAGVIEPAFGGPELGDVGRPDGIGSRRCEVAADKVGGGGHIRSSPAPPTTGMDTNQAFVRHKASDPLLAAALVEAAELGVDPRCAIGGPGPPVNLGDQGGEFGVSHRTVRRWTPVPGVVTRTGNVEDSTEPLDPELPSMLGDEPKAAHRVVSLAK
jgi:hypothetical protein